PGARLIQHRAEYAAGLRSQPSGHSDCQRQQKKIESPHRQVISRDLVQSKLKVCYFQFVGCNTACLWFGNVELRRGHSATIKGLSIVEHNGRHFVGFPSDVSKTGKRFPKIEFPDPQRSQIEQLVLNAANGPGSIPHLYTRNLTPNKTGLPEGGHTFAEFLQI